ncbi:uncharacterized protein LOC133178075 [Saccostrea echinata]|uniref:uncharacterized protein LOC133178075 n=1 Tax=Saccostrea echinata TaxID=191078 RepID=UPI002A82FA41|nr:uncharacterized protein LOC133178075 [Saccostrea echinata]
MAVFLDDFRLRERFRGEVKEVQRRKYSLLHGVSNLFILDTSESMDGEGFIQMKEAYLSMIEERMTYIGLFTIRARVILISDGRPTTLDDSDSKCDQHTEGDHSLLGSIAYESRGGKLLNPPEARAFAKYSLCMMIAAEIIGEVPSTSCSIDDVKNILLSSGPQCDITEHDVENVVEILNNRRAYEMFVYRNDDHLEHEVYSERNESLLAPGTRVRRGPNWHYRNQDSNGPGTVTGHWHREGWIYVEWDTGMRFPYEYVNDSHQENVIIPCDEPRILRRENIAVGCLVKRGPDWKWGDQDGGEGNIGAVYRVKEDAVYVRWSNGIKSNYRFGYGGKYDLAVW